MLCYVIVNNSADAQKQPRSIHGAIALKEFLVLSPPAREIQVFPERYCLLTQFPRL